MALFEGRILITDSFNKDDRDAAVTNILNHKRSRATLYLMLKDFREMKEIRNKFPTVLPFVLIPGENIERTRRMIKLLPHMDHFVNFLGQDLALEFLGKRSDFRIKDISKAYARSNVLDKILLANGKGIIFNVDTSENYCKDNVAAVGIAAKKSIKGSVKKLFFGGEGSSTSTIDEREREPLLGKDHDTHNSEPERINDNHTVNDNSSTANNIWRFIISLFYFVCPCIDDARVILPVSEYPSDMDAKFAEAFQAFYESQNVDWFQKLAEAKHSKEVAIKQLQNSKEERVEKEYNRLMGVNKDGAAGGSNRFQAFVNVRDSIRVQKDKINQEYEQKMDLLFFQHYFVIIEEQMEMLISLWKKLRLAPL